MLDYVLILRYGLLALRGPNPHITPYFFVINDNWLYFVTFPKSEAQLGQVGEFVLNNGSIVRLLLLFGKHAFQQSSDRMSGSADVIERPVFLIDIVLIVIVDMHKGSLYVGKTFQLALQGLAHIMRLAELSLRVHDNVNFNIKLLPGVIGTALNTRPVRLTNQY